MNKLKIMFAISVCAFGAASAQDVDVQGDGTNGGIIFEGKNINTSSSDYVAVQGHSIPAPYYGIGVKGIGGYKGVVGEAKVAGSGDRYGVFGSASGGTNNYGVYGVGSGSGTLYGVLGEATGANSRAGKFVGDLEYTGALVPPSDRKLKKNIKDLRNCVALASKLVPKEYDYRADEYPQMNFNRRHQFGLVAQDVEAVLPDLVSESQIPESPDAKTGAAPETYKNLNYTGLIPVLVGALKEQQHQIEDLTRKIAALEK
jgi:endosialidase-like protein